MAGEIADPFWIEVIELNQRLNRDIIEIVLAELASADEDEEDGLMQIDEEVILAEPLGRSCKITYPSASLKIHKHCEKMKISSKSQN